MAVNPARPLLRAEGIVRRFGPVAALGGVSVELHAGRVHALLGANGAGKSTLARILAGADRADVGTMSLAGAPYAPRDPARARAIGVSMIHQELSIAPHLPVGANIVLGTETTRGGRLAKDVDDARARAALQKLGRADLPLSRPAGELPVAMQQVVEIARALASEVRVLFLDEPTSSLASDDKRRLLALVEDLRAQGIAIAWIGHHLDEVLRLADDLTVLRDGVVAARHVRGVDADTLVRDMSGRVPAPRAPRTAAVEAPVLLELRGFKPRHFRAPVDLAVRAGEILGLAGLVGAGRSRLLRSIVGDVGHDSGAALLDGRTVGLDPRRSAAAGVGFVPEDRKRDGLCLSIPIVDEVSLARMASDATAGVLRLDARRTRVAALVDRVRAKHGSLDDPASTLSGGNQQKLALARLLHLDARAWLLDDPTRGIDVAAKRDIHDLVRERVAEGRCAVVASSDTSELLSWCDRIAVLSRGRIVETRAVDEWDEDSILACAAGATEQAA